MEKSKTGTNAAALKFQGESKNPGRTVKIGSGDHIVGAGATRPIQAGANKPNPARIANDLVFGLLFVGPFILCSGF